MPCYLFTFHAYASWLPDREQGYLHRQAGFKSQNTAMADCYRANMKHAPVHFDPALQRLLLEEALTACEKQGLQPRCFATDASHLHLLVTWRDPRPWEKVRNGLESSLSRRLNREKTRRPWLSKNGSRKRVKDRPHDVHLLANYLPSHGGLKWSPEQGFYQ